MSQSIVIDEIHVQVNAPRGLPVAVTNQMVRTLQQSRFLRQVRAAVREVFGRYPMLRNAHVVITR